MEKRKAIQKLSALSHAGRLDVFRCLVRAEPDGLAAGDISAQLGVQPNTLSAQLSKLSVAGLIHSERDGRSIIYRADLNALNELVLFLIEDCCQGRSEVCAPILKALRPVSC